MSWRMQPQMLDHVYVHERIDRGLNPHGYVINFNNRFKEVLVKFFGPFRGGPNIDLVDPDFQLPGNDVESLTYEEFQDCKVSSECEGKFSDHRGANYVRGLDD